MRGMDGGDVAQSEEQQNQNTVSRAIGRKVGQEVGGNNNNNTNNNNPTYSVDPLQYHTIKIRWIVSEVKVSLYMIISCTLYNEYLEKVISTKVHTFIFNPYVPKSGL
jgi:hypothetical protein